MRTSNKRYSSAAVEGLIAKCTENGYDLMVVAEGCLLEYGKALLIAPDTRHYNFIIRERYLNERSSAYSVDRRACLRENDFQ